MELTLTLADVVIVAIATTLFSLAISYLYTLHRVSLIRKQTDISLDKLRKCARDINSQGSALIVDIKDKEEELH